MSASQPQRLVYLSNADLPSSEASAVNVAQMCDAFAELGWDVALRARRGVLRAVAKDYYALRHDYRIDYDDSLPGLLWHAGRLAWPRVRAREYYFGRKISSCAAFARRGYPVALELHAPPRNGRRMRQIGAVIAARRFCGLVVISAQLRDEVLRRFPRLDPDDVLVAHDGAPATSLCAPRLHQGGPVRAVYCGRLLPGKGADTVVAAAARLPQVEFHLIGGSSAQIAALGQRPSNVIAHGQLSHAEAMRRLRRFDIALAPYATVVHGGRHKPDGANLARWMSPIKLFEYMAVGLPIVSSDLPVLREILDPEETALMTPPGDVGALAQAVQRLAAAPEKRLLMAQRAQARLRDEYTWDRRAEKIAQFITARRRRRPRP